MEKESAKRKLKLSQTNIIKQAVEKTDINGKELNEGIFLINLLQFLNEKEFEYSNIIKSLSILSMFLYIKEDLNGLNDVNNQIKTKIVSQMKLEIESLIKVYYRLGTLLLKKGHLLFSYYYLYQGKTLFESENNLLNNASNTMLNESYQTAINQLESTNLNLLSEYQSKQEEKIRECKRIISIYDSALKQDIISEGKEEKIYLINLKWLENAYQFALIYKDSINTILSDFLQNAFQIRGQLSNYLRNDSLKPSGCYPLEINNYDIIDFSDSWKDNDINHNHENILLLKNIEIKKDYYCIKEDEWEFLNTTFGSTNEIKRYLVSDNTDNNNDSKYEINLSQLKVFILEKQLRTTLKHYLKLKKIQFSKGISIKQFKEKLKRCLELSNIKCQINMYETEILTNEDLLRITVAYIINCNKFQIPLKEIVTNDDDSIETLTTINCPYLLIEVVKTNEEPFIISKIENCSNCSNSISIESAFTCSECGYVS